MELKVKIDPALDAVTVTVSAPAETPEVRELLSLLTPWQPIPGWREGRMVKPLLAPAEVLCFYAREKEVYALTHEGEFLVKLRLYELEETLDPKQFVRISQSELVNLRKVTALDLSLTGTIKMTLEGGHVCWVSRRNVKNIKKALGL